MKRPFLSDMLPINGVIFNKKYCIKCMAAVQAVVNYGHKCGIRGTSSLSVESCSKVSLISRRGPTVRLELDKSVGTGDLLTNSESILVVNKSCLLTAVGLPYGNYSFKDNNNADDDDTFVGDDSDVGDVYRCNSDSGGILLTVV
ncbi:hypothetical protein GQX74_007513 [Glossina fuscipes]|nr:hypothetical protein GQX74_007513 [Glossina fuscipes]